MTDKEKRAGSRSEHANGATGKDNKDNSATTDAERIGPKEVFDSSKYDAMSDMTKGQTWKRKMYRLFQIQGRQQRV